MVYEYGFHPIAFAAQLNINNKNTNMKKTNSESSPAIDRAFINIIEAHKNGRVITDISAALKQVTAAAQLTGPISFR